MTLVVMTSFFPWAFLLHLLRALITFHVAHTILQDRFNTIITFFTIVIPGMIYSYISLSITNRENELYIMLGYYLMMLILVFISTKGNFFQKLLIPIFSVIIYLSSSLIFFILITIMTDESFVIGIQYEMPLTIYLSDVLFVYSFSFVFIAIIKFIKSKTNKKLKYKTKYVFLLLFPITHIFSVMQTFSALINAQTSTVKNYISTENIEIINIVITTICLLLDFSIFFIIEHFEKIEEENIRKERELLKNTMDYHQMMMIKKEKQEFRKIKHDFTNIVTTAKGFIEIGKPEKALSILSDTNEDLLGLAGFSICSNETINTIIYIKQQQAERNNINLLTEICEEYPVRIEDYDLCRILHNIIDNSLNAASSLKGSRYSKISITINEEHIIIKSVNQYTADTERKKSDEHGNGIHIIKDIASKYGGKYAYKQFDDVWYAEACLDNKKPANSTPPPRILA